MHAALQVELETSLNLLKATQQTEHLRATDLATKTVEAEAAVKQVLPLLHSGPFSVHVDVA